MAYCCLGSGSAVISPPLSTTGAASLGSETPGLALLLFTGALTLRLGEDGAADVMGAAFGVSAAAADTAGEGIGVRSDGS